MCDYDCNNGKILTTCNKCWGNGNKDTDDMEYKWTCDKCNGNGYIEIECPVCRN